MPVVPGWIFGVIQDNYLYFQFCEIGRHQNGPPAADRQLSFFPYLPLLRSKMGLRRRY